MRKAMRRFGPVLFWQYTWFLVVVLPLGYAAAWIAGGGTFLEWLCALGMVAMALFGLLVSESFQALAHGGGLGRTRIPEQLRIPEDLTRLFVHPLAFSGFALTQCLNTGLDYGFGRYLLVLLGSWHGVLIGTWAVWALGGLRPEDQTPQPRTDPGPGSTRSRLADSTGDTITVSVDPAGPLTLAEAVRDVLVAQYLPVVYGGAREWTVLVGGAVVGVVVQSWEHPKFWRPVTWSVDPGAPFEGREVSFELRLSTTSLHDRNARAGWASLESGQDRQ